MESNLQQLSVCQVKEEMKGTKKKKRKDREDGAEFSSTTSAYGESTSVRPLNRFLLKN